MHSFLRHSPLWLCTFAALVAVSEDGLAQSTSGDHQYTSADIEAGSRVYSADCRLCHGASGADVDGVDLRLGQFRRALSDDDLRQVITTGVSNARMPEASSQEMA